MTKAIIIAEIGECFNGDLGIANNLMAAAKRAGCDIVKFQTLDYEEISEDDPEKDWFKKIALDPQKIRRLVDYGRDIDIQVLFTPENIKTAKWLLDCRLKDVKIASSSIADIELIRFINGHFRRVFMSTGMASLAEVKAAVRHLDRIKELYIMHCVSEYPTGPLLEKRGLKALAPEDVRLRMMEMLMKIFPQHKVGYSDHTAGILAPIAAVSLGAEVIEKHITLDRDTPIRNYEAGKKYLGTDHVISVEPKELEEMVKQIRDVEKMLGRYRWERSEGEKVLKDFLRRRFTGEKIKDSR